MIQFPLQLRIEEAQAPNLGQVDAPNPPVGHQVEVGVSGVLAAGPGFHPHDGSANPLGGEQLHHLSPHLSQDLSHTGMSRQIYGEALQSSSQRISGGIGHLRDLAAVQVLDHQALEKIVDVFCLEVHIEVGAAGNGSLPLEVAYPAGEQHHLREGKLPFCSGFTGASLPLSLSRQGAANKKHHDDQA